MLKRIKQEKAITLIALVITIIVILILAGISIVTLTGENGIINKANVAKEESKKAEYKEELELIGLGLQVEDGINNLSTKDFMDKYQDEIRRNKKFKEAKVSNQTTENDTIVIIVITKEGYVYKITKTKVDFIGKQGETAPPDLEESDIEGICNPSDWTNGEVKVTVKVNNKELSKYTIKYSLDGKTNWRTYTGQIAFKDNGSLFVRVENELLEFGGVTVVNVANIDRLAPKQFVPTATSTTNSITLTGSTTDTPKTEKDGCSGIKEYYFSNDNGATWKQNSNKLATSYTFNGLTQNKEYTLKMKAVDKAGNEVVTNAITKTTGEFVADGSWNEELNVNTPKLLEGMTGVYWDNTGKEIDVTKYNQNSWYNYSEQKWANAKTEDGSYWVWIPRYEYKINSNDKTINVKFIKTEKITVDNDYTYIHPAFTNGTKNNFKNGEWDKEIPGFWVAKYAAGFQECTQKITNGNIIEPTTDPNKVTYSNKTYTSFSNEGQITNALSQKLTESEYASQKISYPVFKPLTYAYNIISTGDSYTISQEIAKARNFYGLDPDTADSHMMKNSEWGAVVYLSHSNYGINDKKVEMNTKNLINFDKFIFSVTGYARDIPNGVSASTTHNKTGVFDLSGCVWERVSAYITNGDTSLTTYGKSYATLKTSTKYATIYPYNEVDDSNTNNYLEYKNAKYGYGDAVLETSTSETSTSEQEQLTNAWENNYSNYPYTHGTFFVRGGDCSNIDKAGIFAFTNATGNPQQVNGFRAILIGTK